MSRGERVRPLGRMVDPADDVAYATTRALGAATTRDVEARLDDLLRHAGDIDVAPGPVEVVDELPPAEAGWYGQIVLVQGVGAAAGKFYGLRDDAAGAYLWQELGSGGGGGGTIAVQEGGVNVAGAATTLNFQAADFDVTNPSAGEGKVFLATSLDSKARVGVRKNSGATVGERRNINVIEGFGLGVTVADDAGNEEVDVTLAVTDVPDNVSTQRVAVAKAGALTGTRPRLNFIEGANVTLTVADDAGSDEVDITIAASAASAPTGGSLVPVSYAITAPSNDAGTDLDWTDMPSALTELYGGTRNRVAADLTTVTQIRLGARIQAGGSASAKLRPQYSVDGGTNWLDLASTATAADVAINAAGSVTSAWVDIANGAKGAVLLTVFGVSGNGVADPRLNAIHIQVRHAAAATVKYAEVDFGTGSAQTRLTVVDASVTTTSGIMVSSSNKTPTGGFGDEAEWDPILVTAKPLAGSIVITATAGAGSFRAVGKQTVAYVVT